MTDKWPFNFDRFMAEFYTFIQIFDTFTSFNF